MIELTSVDQFNNNETGKIAIKEDCIVSVEEKVLKSGNDVNVCLLVCEIGNNWREYFVTDSYDRILRLAKL